MSSGAHTRESSAAVLTQLKQTFATSAKRDPKQWARDILEEERLGKKVSAIRLRFAREALGRELSNRSNEGDLT
ncbi:hypothetical protein WH367_16510 [Comamonas sp. MYb21]|uniref:hypothetical protein n=1 Tax=Comamonas sp. MYb21 TaxID=1848648 RepID=UPI003096FB37